MSSFVEECRREWKRLGVPDLLADEMATDLEADLAEAQADGVSTAEILGESDPRRFAVTWASERGLVSEQPPRKSRKRLWIGLPIAVALFLVLVVATAVLLAMTTVHARKHVQISPPRAIPLVRVPNLVGLKACHARRIALATGFKVQRFPARRCDALVIGEVPVGGQILPRHASRPALKLRLRLARG